ncbi:MAG: hypothetical protein IPK17_30430 [Chloroflexi bacterium]|uniref:hypothetical protein n=1 Tax=Candidatus Flexifilum breve TaxID=3140694 RepID=UPI0031364B09|nr:hypothetical protein [Chloroflexota bacterium]
MLDSVFAPVNFSAGCTTANLRIDRKNVKSTVKGTLDSGGDKFARLWDKARSSASPMMTMPGVKIGEAVEVGLGTHVHEDVLDRRRVRKTRLS